MASRLTNGQLDFYYQLVNWVMDLDDDALVSAQLVKYLLDETSQMMADLDRPGDTAPVKALVTSKATPRAQDRRSKPRRERRKPCLGDATGDAEEAQD